MNADLKLNIALEALQEQKHKFRFLNPSKLLYLFYHRNIQYTIEKQTFERRIFICNYA